MAVGTAELQIVINAKDEASKTLGTLRKGLGRFAKVAAIGVGALGVATGGATVAAVKMAASYEKAMREVASLGVPAADMARLEDGVLDLSRRLGVDAVEATGALYQAISAGVPPENALAFLETASKAAIAGVTDTETAVDGISSVINAFASEQLTAAEAADIMFETVRGGKTTFEEISGAISNVAPLASAAGVEFGEVSAALATMTASGTATSVATTQIRSAIQSLTKPSEQLTRLFEDAGYASGEAAVKELGFAGAADIVTEATGGSVAEMTLLLGSIEGVQGVLGITGDQAGVFADNLLNMQDATGSADAAFETMSGSFEFQMGRIKAAFETGFIEVGLRILPALTPIAEWVADKLPGAIDGAITAITDFGTSLGGLKGWVDEAGSQLKKLRGHFENTRQKVADLSDDLSNRLGDAASRLEGPLTRIRAALTPITDSFANLGGAVGDTFSGLLSVLEPLLPVIVGGLLPGWAKLAGLLERLTPHIRAFADEAIPAVTGAIQNLTGIWQSFFGGGEDEGPSVFETMKDKAGELVASLGEALPGAIEGAVGLLAQLKEPAAEFADKVGLVASNIIDKAGPAFEALGKVYEDHVKPAFEPAIDLFKKLLGSAGKLVEALGKLVTKVGEELKKPLETLVNGVLPELLAIWEDIVGYVVDDLLPVFDDLVEAAGDFLGEAFGKLTDAVDGLLENALRPFLRLLRAHVLPVLASVVTLVGTTLIAAFTLATDLLTGDFTSAWDFFMGLPDEVALLLVPLGALVAYFVTMTVVMPILSIAWGILTAVAGAFAAVMTLITSPITLVIVGLTLLVMAIIWVVKNWDEILAVIQDLWTNFAEWIVGKWEDFKKLMQRVFSAVLEWLGEHWPKILVIVTGPFGLILAAVITFRDEILGFFIGIRDAIGGVFDWLGGRVEAFTGMLSNIPQKLKDVVADIPLLGGALDLIPGFQHGAQFRVGGVGGADTKTVAFRATPGETVTVAKPGGHRGRGEVLVQQTIIVEGSLLTEQQLGEITVSSLREATRLNQSVLDVTEVVA